MDGLEIETVEVTPEANGDVKVTVPEGAAPAPVAAAELSFAPGDFQSDLAKLAAEQGVVSQVEKPEAAQPQTAPVVPEPVKAVEPAQPATATVTPVPDKFKNAEGAIDEAKVAKSTQAAEEALQKYLEKERALRQTMNSVNALSKGQPLPAPQPQTQPAPQFNLTPFERQAAIDILNDAQALGIQMTEQQAILQARADIRMAEAKHGAEQSLTASLQERLDLQDRKAELEKIAQDDPFVLSPEGFEALSKIRQDNPWVNQSPTPWAAAHSLYLAQQVKQSRQAGQVLNPTPTAKTAIGQPKAPPTPVNAVQRAVVKPSEPNIAAMNPDQISAYAASLGPKAEAAFYAKHGLKL